MKSPEHSSRPSSQPVSQENSPGSRASNYKANKVANIEDALSMKQRTMVKTKVGHVKSVLKNIMDGKFILILMTLVTIFAIIGVSSATNYK